MLECTCENMFCVSAVECEELVRSRSVRHTEDLVFQQRAQQNRKESLL